MKTPDPLTAVDAPKIFLRRKLTFTVVEPSGGRLSLSADGIAIEHNMTETSVNNMWEELQRAHANFFGNAVDDYEWSAECVDPD